MISQAPLKILVAFGRSIKECHLQCLQLEKGIDQLLLQICFYYGGRKFIRKNHDGTSTWITSTREPGCLSAAPYEAGSKDGCAFYSGTSDAAAQITHEAAKCYDVLNQLFLEETGVRYIPESHSYSVESYAYPWCFMGTYC